MPVSIKDHVMEQSLFCSHNHHRPFPMLAETCKTISAASMLGYAWADLNTADGMREDRDIRERLAEYWRYIRTTGYGQAVNLSCQALFGRDFCMEDYDVITGDMQDLVKDRDPAELTQYCLREIAGIQGVINDNYWDPLNPDYLANWQYPADFRITWRLDELFSPREGDGIDILEKTSGRTIDSVDSCVQALHASLEHYKKSDKTAALKLGIAYGRDLCIGTPDSSLVEEGYRQCRKDFLSCSDASRAFQDHLLHTLFAWAQDNSMPVQIHTGYLAGNNLALDNTPAIQLLPIFRRYAKVRFDIFHASWPWCAELGAIAKNYPNVWPDMCWVWAMNPSAARRALDEWLDSVPYNKIFAYGSDTMEPWLDTGYAQQARLGIAEVLDDKIRRGVFSAAAAKDVATRIMYENCREFHGMG